MLGETIWWYPFEDTDQVIESTVQWDSGVPLELRISFAQQANVEWLIGRDLIKGAYDNLGTVQGHADVQAVVTLGTLILSLSSPFGDCKLRTGIDKLAAFVKRTYAEVPAEAEDDTVLADLDAVLADILKTR